MIAVGIDVSKSKSTVAILNADGSKRIMGRNLPKKVKIGKNNLLGGAPYLTIATVLKP